MIHQSMLIRVPLDLHKRLAVEAAESGISLNRLAVDKLSRGQQL